MTENCLEIDDVLFFESLKACNALTPLAISGKKNVHLFEVMTKPSVLSDKNIPLYLLTKFLEKSFKNKGTILFYVDSENLRKKLLYHHYPLLTLTCNPTFLNFCKLLPSHGRKIIIYY